MWGGIFFYTFTVYCINSSQLLIIRSSVIHVVIHHLESRCHCTVGELAAYFRDHASDHGLANNLAGIRQVCAVGTQLRSIHTANIGKYIGYNGIFSK